MKIINVLLTCFLFTFASPLTVFAQDRQDPEQHMKIQKSAKMHGVHSEKLKGVMRHMIATLMARPAEDADAKKKARYTARLVKLSNKVALTAKSIDKYLPEDELNEEEKEKFSELATQLHDEALTTQAAGNAHDTEALNAALDRFNQTCIDCHSLFRER